MKKEGGGGGISSAAAILQGQLFSSGLLQEQLLQCLLLWAQALEGSGST